MKAAIGILNRKGLNAGPERLTQVLKGLGVLAFRRPGSAGFTGKLPLMSSAVCNTRVADSQEIMFILVEPLFCWRK